MTPEEATIKLREAVPEATVVRIGGPKRTGRNRGALIVYVVVPTENIAEKEEAVLTALGELELDPAGTCHGGLCKIFPNETEAVSEAVEELVHSAIDPIVKSGVGYFSEVKARVDKWAVHVRASSPAFSPGESGAALQDKLQEIQPEVRQIAYGRAVYFYTSDGLRTALGPSHGPVDDDDDDDSPNWPSKTDNPSGKGRDNNPPKR